MNTLKEGDRIKLSGGYDMDPAWLCGKAQYLATLISFIPGQNQQPAVVAKLDYPILVENVNGDIVVLELRYVGASWENRGTVHVELCDFLPEPKSWPQRRQGKRIESHATYEKLVS